MTKRIAAIGTLFWSSIILMLGAMGFLALNGETISFGQAVYTSQPQSCACMGPL